MHTYAPIPAVRPVFRRWSLVFMTGVALVVSGCGGSGPRDQTPDAGAQSFTGMIIDDEAQVASAPAASAKAASGPQRTSQGLSGSSTYTVSATNLTAPYIIGNQPLNAGIIALALQPGVVNLTSLTTLQAETIFGSDASSIYSEFGTASMPASMVTAASLQAAQAKVIDFVQNTLGATVASGLGDFATANFSATSGDPMFATLTSLAARKRVLGATYDTLVATFVNEAHFCNAQKITVTIGSATAVDFCPSSRTANRETADATIVDAVFVNQAGAVLTVRVRDAAVLGASYQLANGGATYTCTGNACAITVSAADAITGGLPLSFLQSPLDGPSGSAVLNGNLLSAEPAAPPAPLPCPTTAAPVTLTLGGIAVNDFCPASVAAPRETADPTIIDAGFTDATGSTLTVRVQGSTVLDATYASASGFSYTCSGSACAITVGTPASSGALPLAFAQSTLAGAADSAVINGTLLSAVPGASSGPPACLANATSFQLTVGGDTAVFCPSSKSAVREANDQTIVDATIGNSVGTLTVRFHSDTAVVVDATYVDAASNSYTCSSVACSITVGTPDASTNAVPLTFAASILNGSAGSAEFDGTVSTATPPALLPVLSCSPAYQYFFVYPNQSVLADCIPDVAGNDYFNESGFFGSQNGESDEGGYALYGTNDAYTVFTVQFKYSTGTIVSVTAAHTDPLTGVVSNDYKCRGSDCNGVTIGSPVSTFDTTYNLQLGVQSVSLTNTKLAMVNSDGSLSTSVYATFSASFTGLYQKSDDYRAAFYLTPPVSAADCAASTSKVLTAPADESYIYGICPTNPSDTYQRANGGLRITFPMAGSSSYFLDQDYVSLNTDASGAVTSVVVNQIHSGANEVWGCSGNCSGVTVSAPDSSGNYAVTFANALMHVVEADGFPTGVRTAVVNGSFTAPAPTPGEIAAGTRSTAQGRVRLTVPQATSRVPISAARRASAAASK